MSGSANKRNTGQGENVAKRAVLAGAALTTAALIVPITVRRSRAAERDDGYEITDWIAIAPSGEVTLALSQPEVGQGSYTALPQILADELDARLDERIAQLESQEAVAQALSQRLEAWGQELGEVSEPGAPEALRKQA